MKIGCIAQARATSTRLPGKVLKTLDFDKGTSILQEVILRLKTVKNMDEIIVATTTNEADNDIVKIAKENQVKYYRGSELDVLERFYLAARENSLDVIIRITSDCPFVDPYVLEDLIELYKEGEYDYVSNGQKRTYPHGLDCEIFSMEALKKAYDQTDYVPEDMFFREHVTTYIYTHPNEHKIGSLELPKGEDYSDIRITVDTRQDYALACIVKDMIKDKEDLSFRHIIELYRKKPYLKIVNENITQKKQYENENEEYEVAVKMLRLQELNRAASLVEEKIKDISND